MCQSSLWRRWTTLRSDWRPDPRERAEPTRKPHTVYDAQRVRRVVKTLMVVWCNLTANPPTAFDPHRALERRLRFVIAEDGDENVVELVALRLVVDQRSRFSAESLRSLSFDQARREVVAGLPEDTPEAWRWCLWAEKLSLSQAKHADSAGHWVDQWRGALEAGDEALVTLAKGRLAALWDKTEAEKVTF